MNKIYRFIIASFLVTIMGLSLVTVKASAMDGRCDPNIWDVQKTQAEAMVIKDTAITAELIPQNDSTLGMTCFDQAMVQTAKAGSIFSDVATPPTSLTAIATGLLTSVLSSGINAGFRGETLMQNLNDTIGGVVTDLMGNFMSSVTGAITSAIGSALGGIMTGFLGNIGAGLVGSFFGGAGGINSAPFNCDNLSTAWTGSTVGLGKASNTAALSYDSIYDYAVSGVIIPGIVGGYQGKLDEPANKVILQKAGADLTALRAKTIGSSMKVVPGIGVGSNLAAVTGAM